MALSLHQHGSNATGASSTSFNIGAISAGDCIVVYTFGDANGNGWTISDGNNPNANYIKRLEAYNFGAFGNGCYVLTNSVAIANATITVSQTNGLNTQTGMIVHVWSGADTTAPFDVGVTASSTSASPASGNTATVAGGNEVALGFTNFSQATTINSAGTGYILDDNNTGGGIAGMGSEHKLLTPASGVQSAGFTLSVSDSWNCVCVVIKEAPSGAPNPFSNRMRLQKGIQRTRRTKAMGANV